MNIDFDSVNITINDLKTVIVALENGWYNPNQPIDDYEIEYQLSEIINKKEQL